MAVFRYPKEVHDFIKAHVEGMRDQDLAELCNRELGTSFTAKTLKSFRGNHGYKNGLGKWTKEDYWKYQKIYPQGMYEFIRDNSWGVSSKEMAELCNEKFGTSWTQTGMKQFRQRHGIKSGETGWYQKGHVPGNKGKKLEEYVTDPERAKAIREKLAKTQFKKGQHPQNELPIGAIVVNDEGFKLRKKQMDGGQWERWEFLHRAVWREHYGEIPEGMMIVFRDGNRANCDISNLMMISKQENAALNKLGLRSKDPDLTEAGVNLVRLRLAVKEAKKRKAK